MRSDMADEELLGDLPIQWKESLEQGRDFSAAERYVDCAPRFIR
jgi:hypothetical protein